MKKYAHLPPTLGQLRNLVVAGEQHRGARLAGTPATKPRQLRRRLDRTVTAEIVSKYRAGETTPRLAKEYSVSKSALLDLLRREGVSLRRQPMTRTDVEKVVALYEQGLSMAKIAERLGTSYNNVRENLLRVGVQMRVRGGTYH